MARWIVFLCISVLIGAGIYFYRNWTPEPQVAIAAPAKQPDNGISSTSELFERERVKRHVNDLLIRSNFDALEALASRYRDSKERSPSGLWYLTHFYDGVDRHFLSRHSVPEKSSSGTKWKENTVAVHAKAIASWQKAYPNSPAPYLAHAMWLRKQAWAIRGNSYANKVPGGAWAPFLAKLQEARDYLNEHSEIASRDPHWYALQIQTATELDESMDTVMDLLAQGLDSEPYYYPLYFAATRHLLPKWDGESQYIDAFANMAVQRTSENEGMSLYARIYWYVSQAQYGGPALFSGPSISWDKMTAGMDDVLKQYPDIWNINNFLFFACIAGDRAQSKKLLGMMRGEPLELVWRKQEYFGACKDFALGKDLEEGAAEPN